MSYGNECCRWPDAVANVGGEWLCIWVYTMFTVAVNDLALMHANDAHTLCFTCRACACGCRAQTGIDCCEDALFASGANVSGWGEREVRLLPR